MPAFLYFYGMDALILSARQGRIFYMSQISIDRLYFHYDSPYQEIFSGLSLAIPSGWKTALIGKNGRGKTTLLSILSGSLEPSAGKVTVPMEIKYFPYTPPNDKLITLDVIRESIAPFSFWENEMTLLLRKGDEKSLNDYSRYLELFTRYDGYAIDSLIEKEAVKMSLPPDLLTRPFYTLSGGEKTRALILPLFLRKDCFPLLDEPTDHLDLQGREMLAEYLAGSKKGFITASHDRYLLDYCTDHTISINKTDVSVIHGNYSAWKNQKDLEDGFEQRRSDNLQREIRDLEKAAMQRRKWSSAKEKEKNSAHDSGFVSHKAAKMMKRAISIERRIEDNIQSKRELLKNKETNTSIIMKNTERPPERLININDLSVIIEDRKIITGFYMEVSRGERVAVTGENGCGKTTLLNVISGSVPAAGGDIYVARNVKTARAYQMPLWTEGFLKDHIRKESIDMTGFRFIMSAFGLKGEIFDRPLETFSRGQQRKIDLCRTIIASPQLLIWDEPLNHLDIGSREQLEEFISREDLSVIFVEHDRRFIENTATRIIRMDKLQA